MLKIKLARFGKRNQPHFRIVVNEARDKRDGQYVALLGHYAPAQQPKILKLDLEAYQGWIAKGAQPTETVAALAQRAASDTPFPPKAARLSKKAKAKQAAASEAPAEETPAAAVETPAAEQPATEPAESSDAAETTTAS